MRLWHGFADHLAEEASPLMTVYVALLAGLLPLAGLLSNLVPALGTLSDIAWLLLLVPALYSISQEFHLRLRSGHPLLLIATEHTSTIPAQLRVRYRFVLGFTRFVVSFFVFLAGSMAFAAGTALFIPSLAQAQHVDVDINNVWVAVLVSAMGALEEYWRWAVIVILLLTLKRLFPYRWTQSAQFRNTVLWAAVLACAMLYGLGHVAEFSSDKGWAWFVLTMSGLIMSLSAIATRSFLLPVVLHFTYDLIATTHAYASLHTAVYIIAIITLAVTAPLFLYTLNQLQPHLKVNTVHDNPATGIHDKM